MSATTTEQICPRCSTPSDAIEVRCVFCMWPLEDEGLDCVCGWLNKAEAQRCKLCDRTL